MITPNAKLAGRALKLALAASAVGQFMASPAVFAQQGSTNQDTTELAPILITGSLIPTTDIVGRIGRQKRHHRVEARRELPLTNEAQRVLTASRCRADAGDQQVHMGVESVLRPQREGKIGDEEVPVAGGILAIEKYAQARVGNGSAGSADRR